MNLPLYNIPSKNWEEEYKKIISDPYIAKKYNRNRRISDKIKYINEFLPNIKNGNEVVLDIGPGPCEFLEVCRFFNNEIYGIDATSDESEMGYEYLRLSELMAERQKIPVKYIGLDKLILNGNLSFEDEKFTVINSQGSIEQVCEDYMDGDKSVKHKDARLISWNESDDTLLFFNKLFLELKRILKIGGILMIYGNGSKNVDYYNWMVNEFCDKNNMKIIFTKYKCLHKIIRVK